MGRGKKFIALLIVFLLPAFFAAAEEDTLSFVIAPPPVGYPVFEKGRQDFQAGGNAVYVSSKVMDTTFKLYGGTVFGNYQYCLTGNLSFSGSIGASLLAGDKYDLLMVLLPLQGNIVYEFFKTARHSFYFLGGLGGDIGSTSMTIEVPQVVNIIMVTDETTLQTITGTGRVTLGGQANFGLGKFILSPFVVYTYTRGTWSSTQTSAMSFDYPSSSGTLSGYSTTIIGFDLLYRPWNVSLSSQVHQTDRTTLVSLAMKWLLSKDE
jgi:hypothetical protein